MVDDNILGNGFGMGDPSGTPQPEPETTSVSDETPQEPIPGEEPVEPIEGEEEALQEPEYVEVEYEGKVYKVDKALEGHLLRDADYTQKAQALAEEKRQQAEAFTKFQEDQRLHVEFLNDVASIRAVDLQLQRYQNIDWNAWDQQDFQASQSAYRQFQQLRDHKSQMIAELDNKAATRRAEQEKLTSAELQEAVAALQAPDAEIGWPGYTPQRMADLTKDAIDYLGVPVEELRRIRKPLAIKILNLAVGMAKSLKASRQPKPVTALPQQTKIPKTVSGTRARSAPNPDNMSMDQFVKWQTELKKAGKIKY